MVTAHTLAHTPCTATGGARAFGTPSSRIGQSFFHACMDVDRFNCAGEEVGVVTVLVYAGRDTRSYWHTCSRATVKIMDPNGLID